MLAFFNSCVDNSCDLSLAYNKIISSGLINSLIKCEIPL